MQRLSGLDASFLYLETPEQLLHVCGLVVVDPGTVPGGYSFASLKDRLAALVVEVPEFRRRLRHVPFDLDHPVWVDDEHFSIDRHAHRAALPAPGGVAELAELCGHLAGQPLDRSRPLWELWVIEGLADGRLGIFFKMHHATVDGLSGMSLLSHLCSLEPEPPTSATSPATTREIAVRAEPVPGDWHLLGRGIVHLAARPARLVRLAAPTFSALAGTVDRARHGVAMAAPFTAPRTPFNATISGRRAVAFADLPLDAVKAVKNATGTTVNDVVLTVCGGALRGYLEARGELPEHSLLATVPVSVRGSSPAQGSNQVSAFFARLGTDVADPLKRLAAVATGNRRAKEHHQAIPASALQDWAELAAPRTFGVAVRVYSRLRLAERHPVVHNLVISNVPGPPVPLFLLGARVEAMYPLGPVFHGAGLNVTVISNNGRLHVGLIACADLVPDLDELASQFARELDTLVSAAADLPDATAAR